MSINSERLWSRIIELSQIGADSAGGVTRFSYTEYDRLAKQLVTSYMVEAGMSIREDEVGNLIGRYEGTDPTLPIVMTGSHIDTVKQGGKFDGALGVLAAIEAIQTMQEQGISTKHAIEVIAFADEEGSRFGFGMIGSRALAGTLLDEQLLQTDEHGISIREAMEQAGFYPALVGNASRTSDSIKGYVELHIEQGKVLESQHQPIGIVTGIAGPLWLSFTLKGQAGHAGATPMNMRRDPLQAATKIFNYIYEVTSSYEHAVATIGKLTLLPGGVNIIPAELQFTVDLRDIDEQLRNDLESKIRCFAEKVCKEFNIELAIEVLQRVKPVKSSLEMIAIIEKSAVELGYLNVPKLVSGAGHDGMQFHSLCPVGMIFVRSKDGISHNPLEWSEQSDCTLATNLLYKTLLNMAINL